MAESSFKPRSHLTSAFAFVSNFKMDSVATNDGVHISSLHLTANIKKNTIRCCDMGQNDTIGKIELNPSFVLSSDNTNCKNDIQ